MRQSRDYRYSPSTPTYSRFGGGRGAHPSDYDDGPYAGRPMGTGHQPTRPVDKDKTEAELSLNIKKATSPEETAPSELILCGWS